MSKRGLPILDDLRALDRIDKADMLGAAGKQLSQLTQRWGVAFEAEPEPYWPVQFT